MKTRFFLLLLSPLVLAHCASTSNPPGPEGAGGKLLDELMSHLTQREFVYVHEWDKGDVVIWDNRCLVHAATWFDAATQERLMWRTTVHGNPGAFYAGERKSWIPQEEVAAE